MKKTFLAFIQLFLIFSLFASADYRKEFVYPEKISRNGRFKIQYDMDTKIYSCYEVSSMAKQWEIETSAKKIYVSDDGIYGIAIDELIKEKTVNDIKHRTGFTVYKNGQILAEKSIDEILTKVYMAKRTGASYYWGKIEKIFENGIIFYTVEGYKFFSFNTRNFPAFDNDGIYTPWTDDQLVDYSLRQISNQIYEYYNFMITKNSSEDFDERVSFSYLGTYGGAVTAPASVWSITNQGFLEIYETPGNRRYLKKIYLDAENEVAYIVKDNKLIKYEYHLRTW